ncbi:E3 ubiquitin-protein ligase TRIM56-like [Bolinopsis microptera]|uniref:E3 ubiquitin-protein ligase TRIM56-like n=1 Tax=Bolinopsis microptera TaxID=2820187 RepID=UPI00307AAAFD
MSKSKLKRTRSKALYIDSEVSSDKLQDDITCKGCFKEFTPNRIPKILNCLHNLCSECINMSIELNSDKNKVLCPTCKNHSVGKDAETFRTHSYVHMLSDIAQCYRNQMSGSLKCIGCNNVAGLRCLTCNENYCQEHTDFHVRSRATSHHKVLSFKQILNAPLIVSTIKREEHCPNHKKKVLEFFCFTCKLPICTVCALANHKGCIYEELSIAVSALKEKFDNLKPAFNRKAYNLKKMTSTLDTGMKQVEGDFGHSMANVSDVTDKIMRQLRQKESGINLQIEDHRKDSQGELRIHQSLVEDKIANLESGTDFVDTVFEYWSPLEVLSVENDIVKRLTELSAEPEEFGCDSIKPKAFDLPPDLETNVVDAIGFLENGAMPKKE